MKIYVEQNAGLTDEGQALDDRITAALKPIVEHCVEQGADLRLAQHLATKVIDNLFSQARLLLVSQKRKHERKRKQDEA